MDTPRLAERLAAAAADAVVGREQEVASLLELLRPGHGPAVVFVTGPGGIGKTSLVAATVARAGAATWVDGRAVEPTPAGLEAAIGDPTAIGDVLVVDAYERLAIVDGWLRNSLLPQLPATTTTVLVGRSAPNVAWRTSPGWRSLLAEIVVGPLDDDAAGSLLARRGTTGAAADQARRFARGHPLALELAAEALARHPELELHGGAPPEAVEELVEVLFDDLDGGDRRVVEAAAVLRRVTEPLLAAVVDVPVARAWATVRALPFVDVTPAGLVLNPVVQDVAVTALELRDPGRVRELRRRAARAALVEIARAPGWAATADLLHLVQNPLVRGAFAPPAGAQHPVEEARPDDRDDVLAVVARHDGPAAAEVLGRWWELQRDAFVVARDAHGRVAAVGAVARADELDPGLAGGDPVLAALLAHLDDEPLAPGDLALVNRVALGAARGSRPSPELGAMYVDIKRTYLALRPALARVYAATSTWATSAPTLEAMGFRRLGDPVDIGGRELQPCLLEFGPGSVDGWLARHVEAETATAAEAGGSAVRRGDDRVAALSPREREVLAALADGLSNRELADRLFISERTANRHLSNIFAKLGVGNRTAAARIAFEAGLAAARPERE